VYVHVSHYDLTSGLCPGSLSRDGRYRATLNKSVTATFRVLQEVVRDVTGNAANGLQLWADGPRWEYSTVPLAAEDGKPVEGPKAGTEGGHALALTDQQVKTLFWPCREREREREREEGGVRSLGCCRPGLLTYL
jgi:hypothetical protein